MLVDVSRRPEVGWRRMCALTAYAGGGPRLEYAGPPQSVELSHSPVAHFEGAEKEVDLHGRIKWSGPGTLDSRRGI